MKPHVSKSAEYKNIESHVKSCESLEKKWRSTPLDPGAIRLLNNSLNNVEKTLGKVTKPNMSLKAAIMKVSMAINDFKDDHNEKFVAKIQSGTIEAIPGGMKAIESIGIKEFTPENTAFRKATGALKQDATTLLSVYKAFRGKINVSARLNGQWDHAKNNVLKFTADLKEAAKSQDDAARKTALDEYKKALGQMGSVAQSR